MSFSQLLSILKARRLVALGVFLFTVTVTVVVSLLLPKQYSAEAMLVVDVKSPDPIMGMVLPGMMSPAYMGTQIEVIQSERVARKVISMLKLGDVASIREQWREETDGEGDFEAWLTDLLQNRLDVKPSRDANVISVSYSAVDPRFASALANAFVQAYISTDLELRVEPAKQYNAMFEDQTRQVKDRLAEAQSKLSAYQKEKGLIATDERLDVETQRLNELSSQLVALQAVTAESISRQAQFGNNAQEVLNNPVVGALKADLSRQEARLKELQARLGDAHPQVQEQKANVNELVQRIESESRRVASSVGINKTVALSREGQLRLALEEQRTKILKLKAQRDEASVLLRDVENAQRAYDALQVRLYQSNLETKNNQTNISVLKAATPPAKHSSPKLLLNTALAIFMGALLGIGCALLLELRDRRLRTDDDVVQELGTIVIGAMPLAALASGSKPASRPLLKGKAQPKLAAPAQ